MNINNPMIMPPLIWRSHKRARHLSLKLDVQKRALIITHPPAISKKQALTYLYEQAEWVQASFQQLPKTALEKGTILLNGQEIPLSYHLTQDKTPPPPYYDNSQIILYGQSESDISSNLKKFLFQKAKKSLPASLHHQEERLNIFSKKLSLRDVKTRWGSCTKAGHIMLNWRLIMAPPAIQNYVIIHELCHLKYFNHSANFWNFVDDSCENGIQERKKSEKWLKNCGITLLSCI